MLILSSGSLSTVETAARFPIRLLESGPAGGAIFASTIAREIDRREVLSFDLGGTTAKFCLVDDGRALTALGFEVGRTYRFKRGSGLPVRIPVVDLVEIGAGGGSIARLDPIGRITAGPDSAGSEPGPACYGRGGDAPTVTDCDLVLGKLDAATFAGGTMPLDTAAAERRAGARPGGTGRALAGSRRLRGHGDRGRDDGLGGAGPCDGTRSRDRGPHDGGLRRRGPAARGPFRRKAGHPADRRAHGGGRGIRRRLPPRSRRLRNRAQRRRRPQLRHGASRRERRPRRRDRGAARGRASGRSVDAASGPQDRPYALPGPRARDRGAGAGISRPPRRGRLCPHPTRSPTSASTAGPSRTPPSR